MQYANLTELPDEILEILMLYNDIYTVAALTGVCSGFRRVGMALWKALCEHQFPSKPPADETISWMLHYFQLTSQLFSFQDCETKGRLLHRSCRTADFRKAILPTDNVAKPYSSTLRIESGRPFVMAMEQLYHGTDAAPIDPELHVGPFFFAVEFTKNPAREVAMQSEIETMEGVYADLNPKIPAMQQQIKANQLEIQVLLADMENESLQHKWPKFRRRQEELIRQNRQLDSDVALPGLIRATYIKQARQEIFDKQLLAASIGVSLNPSQTDGPFLMYCSNGQLKLGKDVLVNGQFGSHVSYKFGDRVGCMIYPRNCVEFYCNGSFVGRQSLLGGISHRFSTVSPAVGVGINAFAKVLHTMPSYSQRRH
eukprot:TRINITY_DN7574_c0_g1_i1.p2 TRINITY_DN7574_c0_g1~~TRINITY_DN7574_c0_g1_i1.p2  ORF type:complete len:369 (+),score=83.07 TRINITY_DN7574_c0_g1_i1:1634-2740(+)